MSAHVDTETPQPSNQQQPTIERSNGLGSWLKDSRNPNWLLILLVFVGAALTWATTAYGAQLASLIGWDIGKTKITITNAEAFDQGFTPPVKLEGKVKNLRPGQTVWTFDSPEAENIYAHTGGPCSVNDDGDFTCPSFYAGEPKDSGRMFRLWVSVLDDDSQVGQQIELTKNGNAQWPGITREPPGAAKDHVETIYK